MAWRRRGDKPLSEPIMVRLRTHQCVTRPQWVNTLMPRQNGRHCPDDIFKCTFLKENVRIAINISLDFVPKSPINNIPGLVEIIAWHRTGDRALYEPMMARLPTHICLTRPQWVEYRIWPVAITDRPSCQFNWGYSAGVFQASLLVASVVSYVPCILVQNHFIVFT